MADILGIEPVDRDRPELLVRLLRLVLEVLVEDQLVRRHPPDHSLHGPVLVPDPQAPAEDVQPGVRGGDVDVRELVLVVLRGVLGRVGDDELLRLVRPVAGLDGVREVVPGPDHPVLVLYDRRHEVEEEPGVRAHVVLDEQLLQLLAVDIRVHQPEPDQAVPELVARQHVQHGVVHRHVPELVDDRDIHGHLEQDAGPDVEDVP